MAISIGANGKRIAYGIKHYNVDTTNDLGKLPRFNLPMGCTCFVIETSKHYMLNGEHKWQEVKPFGTSSGGSSGGDDFIYEGGDPDDSFNDDVIYEGGIL
jgi:hypothetical protein